MVKSSILFALLLGVVIAQIVPAFSSESDSEVEGSDNDDTDDEEVEEESDNETAALTCLLFENLGCNTECSTIASAFSLEGTGKCTEENICQCEIEQDGSLEGLFRAKFSKAEDALKRIKKDEELSAKVLKILQVPFQTIDQTKRQLREVVYPAIYSQLFIDDKTPAWELGLVGETDKLNNDKIKKYVSEKLKPVLKSSKQLTSVNYKSNMKKSLEGKSNEDLQSIFNEVRRTKNKNLNDIVDDYLKSSKIKEIKNTEKDDIANAIGYQIIDQFINYIEDKKKTVAKKPARKPSKKSPIKSKSSEKKPTKQEKSETPKKSSSTNEKTKKNFKGSSSSRRFELPDFDKDFLQDYNGGSVNETFKEKDYSLDYSKSTGGSIDFTWKKGKDKVAISISSGGSINQLWHLDDAKIKLERSSGGAINQSWNFGKTTYTYTKSSGGSITKNWSNGRRDQDSLKKYQSLMDEWCKENNFLLINKKQCTIY